MNNKIIVGNLQNVKYSTTAPIQIKLNPNLITGFVDGEGSFIITVWKNPKIKIGWSLKASLSIGLHKKDLEILELIKSYFGVSAIYKHGKDSVQYRVYSLQDLIKIIDHFDKYPLIIKTKAGWFWVI